MLIPAHISPVPMFLGNLITIYHRKGNDCIAEFYSPDLTKSTADCVILFPDTPGVKSPMLHMVNESRENVDGFNRRE